MFGSHKIVPRFCCLYFGNTNLSFRIPNTSAKPKTVSERESYCNQLMLLACAHRASFREAKARIFIDQKETKHICTFLYSGKPYVIKMCQSNN